MSFQRLITVWLKARGSDRGSPYTVEEAARLFDVPAHVMAGWMNGGLLPAREDYARISQVMGYSVSTIRGHVER